MAYNVCIVEYTKLHNFFESCIVGLIFIDLTLFWRQFYQPNGVATIQRTSMSFLKTNCLELNYWELLDKLYQLMLISIFYQADNGVGVCFAEDVFAVGFYSAFGDVECFGYLFIVVFFFYQLYDLYFTAG